MRTRPSQTKISCVSVVHSFQLTLGVSFLHISSAYFFLSFDSTLSFHLLRYFWIWFRNNRIDFFPRSFFSSCIGSVQSMLMLSVYQTKEFNVAEFPSLIVFFIVKPYHIFIALAFYLRIIITDPRYRNRCKLRTLIRLTQLKAEGVHF